MNNIVKKDSTKRKGFFSFILGILLYIVVGIGLMLFIYIASHSTKNTELYHKYTRKVLSEIERHELLKHQIAQGTLILDKEKITSKNDVICDNINSKKKVSAKEKAQCAEQKVKKESVDEINTIKVFRNNEIIQLDNASIRNDSYSILSTFDFSQGNHLFSNQSQLCHLIKYLAPEMKESIFTTVKVGDYIVRKDTKKTNLEDTPTISKDCVKQFQKITIETKFYPKDLNFSPAQTEQLITQPIKQNEIQISK